MHRISWEQYALELAKTASLRSEDPYKRVGACALSFDNRVLGVAYNGLKSEKKVSSDFWVDRDKRRPFMIHAESNLLSLFSRNEARIIAVTMLPCASCARLICAWNINNVIYNEEYVNDDALHSKDIFNFYNVNLKKIDYLDK
jgi:dCMP deaminase